MGCWPRVTSAGKLAVLFRVRSRRRCVLVWLKVSVFTSGYDRPGANLQGEEIMSRQRNSWSLGRRGVIAAAAGATALCLFAGGTAWAATTPIEVLKEMPAKGSVRQGDVVYVDDGRCPAGEVKKITGGNQKTGVGRQVECVKRPHTTSEP